MIDTARFSAAAAAEGFELTARQLEQFDQYAQFLVEYNEKVNLTAITDPEGIEVKHFLDSLMLLKAVELPEGASVIDVGTGAGFPSVPAKIVRDDLRLTLLDGLNKRIVFLGELSRRLGQENTALHARAEEAARGELREQFDLATAGLWRISGCCGILPAFCEGGRVVCRSEGTGRPGGSGGGKEGHQSARGKGGGSEVLHTARTAGPDCGGDPQGTAHPGRSIPGMGGKIAKTATLSLWLKVAGGLALQADACGRDSAALKCGREPKVPPTNAPLLLMRGRW